MGWNGSGSEDAPPLAHDLVLEYLGKAEFTQRALAAGQVSIRMKFAKVTILNSLQN
jgi:hypothetical protein